MSKHTPGPWKVTAPYKGRDAGGFIIWNADRTLCVCDRRGWEYNEDESNANGRLIAAAPEMLAALHVLYDAYCSLMRSEYSYPGNPWTPDRFGDKAAVNARAAIAKAEGE